jgi:ech hydrogenase subunit A
MSSIDWLMAVAILLPLVAGILCFIIRDYTVRGIIVVLTAVALIVASIKLFLGGPTEYDITSIGGLHVGELISILDFVVLLIFLYAGISLKRIETIILALAQILPLGYFEFVKGVKFETSPAFYIDQLSIVMVMVISIIGSLICIYAIRYMKDHEHHKHVEKSRQSRFLFWLVMFLGAMNGLVLANNLFWLLFFWEVTTLCCFQLIAHDLTKEAINNACRAMWMNLLGALGLMIAILYLTQTVGPEGISLKYIISGGLGKGVVALLPLALMVFTGFTKSAQLPFQSWLLGAMVAPTPVSALLHSSTMVKAGVYLVVRLAPAFRDTMVSDMVAIVGAFTFLAASVLAISQTNGKRVLAYSTIANLGLIVAAAGINTPLAMTACILLIIFHAISKGLLFLCAGTIEHGIWSREIEDMEGLAAKMPLTTAITAIGIVSMVLPPFGVLMSKWAALEAAAQVPIAGLLFVLASAVTAVFWVKWLGRLLQAPPTGEAYHVESMSAIYTLPLIVLAGGAVVLSIMVGTVLNKLVIPAVAAFYANAPAAFVGQGMNLVAQGFTGPVAAAGGSEGIGAVGLFAPWPLFVVLGIALVLTWLLVSVKKEDVRPAYMCGEHVENVNDTSYISIADQKAEIQLGGYYFMNSLGEAVLNKWVNTIAIILLVIMLGVVYL